MTEPFIFANGQVAHSSKDLVKLCKDFPTDGIRYLLREDLEKWLVYIGDDQIAQYASTARTAALDDAQKLDSFLSNLQSFSPKTEANETESTPVVVQEPEVKNIPVAQEVVIKEEVATTQEVIQELEVTREVSIKEEFAQEVESTKEVDVKTEIFSQPLANESKDPVLQPTTPTKSTVSPRTKTNIFHWIADLFRS